MTSLIQSAGRKVATSCSNVDFFIINKWDEKFCEDLLCVLKTKTKQNNNNSSNNNNNNNNNKPSNKHTNKKYAQ